MRNWYQRLIKSPLSNNNNFSISSDKITIGVIDDKYIQFIKNGSFEENVLDLPNYKHAHVSFNDNDLSLNRRVFFRRVDNKDNTCFTQNISIDYIEKNLRNHGTSVSGISIGKEINNNLIEGISSNSRLIYSNKDLE